MKRDAQRKAQEEAGMEDARRQMEKDKERIRLKEKKQAYLQREAAEEKKSVTDLLREAVGEDVEKEKAKLTAEAAEAVDDDDDDDSVIPNRKDHDKEARDTPWTSTSPRVLPSAVKAGTSTECDDAAKFENDNMTSKVTRDLTPEMSSATMTPQHGGKPERKPLTQARQKR